MNKIQIKYLAEHIDSPATQILIRNLTPYFKIRVTKIETAVFINELLGIGCVGYYNVNFIIDELKILLPMVIPHLDRRKKCCELVLRLLAVDNRKEKLDLCNQIKKLESCS